MARNASCVAGFFYLRGMVRRSGALRVFFEVTVTPSVWGRETAAGTTLSAALIYTVQPDN